MSPRPADPAVRTALVETAARLIASEGPDRLTLRRVAEEVGTSTMAVYTHFGGMDELRREVRREGFARLETRLASVDATSDPVADVGVLGWAYYVHATTEPNLYRAMFMEGPVDDVDATVGLETFDQLVAAIQRCLDIGRFRAADPVELARQLWAVMHGAVTLQLAGLLDPSEALSCCGTAARNLFVAFGDDPADTAASMGRMLERLS